MDTNLEKHLSCSNYYQSINILNGISTKYPHAISLASGSPDNAYSYQNHIKSGMAEFEEHCLKKEIDYNTVVHQYSPTKGIANEIISQHLLTDYTIKVDSENIITTVGFQESVLIAILCIFQFPKECLIIPDPVFPGIAGAARLARIDIIPVPSEIFHNEMKLELLIRKINASGKKVKAIYTVPDFCNPSADTLTLMDRKNIINLAERYDFYILEDNAYTLFRFKGENISPIKQLSDQRVFYIGTFSKTLFPGLRVGYLATPKTSLSNNFSHLSTTIKTFTTVNTPPICQAIVAGILLKNDFSLREFNKERLETYKIRNKSIEINIKKNLSSRSLFSQNPMPKINGGFFRNLKLPFKFGTKELDECAKKFNVIVFPISCMSFFENTEKDFLIRISFVNNNEKKLSKALNNLFNFIDHKLVANDKNL
ncbi:pyridoxal phosphate-dependent aminotransferase [Halomonas sp. NPDC076908]|uniref:pyridoxal phosphate-dependent aminotransferase n=1 Tax=Halomonas sp. NPDC076908 TaxID=3390567 RepID=UPI003D06EBF2